MILKIHFPCKGNVALGMGMLLEIAATRERLQALNIRECFVTEAKDTLGGFAFDLEDFRKIRGRRAGR